MSSDIVMVQFFDGIYEITRYCYYLGHGLCRIMDRYPDGQEEKVFYHGSEFIHVTAAIQIMDSCRS